MYGLALGIGRIGERLPDPVYALLSGLNSATVGIIALAAVQLSEKAITDRLTRILVAFGGIAGMLYTALWYFPVLMIVGGCATVVWDKRWLQDGWKRIRGQKQDVEMDAESPVLMASLAEDETPTVNEPQKVFLRRPTDFASASPAGLTPAQAIAEVPVTFPTGRSRPQVRLAPFSWKMASGIIAFFFATFIAIMVTRAKLTNPSRPFSLFANLYLAGTIIFGGGTPDDIFS